MSADASVLAHGVHYSVLGAGLLGLFVLLGPHAFGQHGHAQQQRRHDEHDRRVLALRRQLGRSTAIAVVRPHRVAEIDSAVEQLLLPLAVVSSAAAAGIHAAVGPAHFREQTLFGIFFAASALLQLFWSVAMAMRPTRSLLIAGAAGNLAVVTLWLVTRTLGLPWGLLPRPEAVGPWDMTCAVWELMVVTLCILALRSGNGRLRLPGWTQWSITARGWALVSALTLVALSLSGAGS